MLQKLFVLLVMTAVLTACGGGDDAPAGEGVQEESTAVSQPTQQEPTAAASEPTVLTLMSHDSFAISEDVLQAFEAENNVTIELLPAGDTGAALNQAILTKDNPLADVFFGVDNTFMGRALAEDIFIPYESPLLDEVPETLKLDSTHRLTPIDYGDVCLNYDIAYFAENGLDVPETLSDLIDSNYESLLVVENPATSSPGLAFLLATIAEFGTEGDYTYLDFWADLRANDVMVTNGWEEAYYGAFTVGGGGERPLVVSYASSPPAEFIYADPPVEAAPTASVVAAGTCYRQVEFAGILRGTEQEALAQKLIDFMLSTTFQEDIPLNMFVFPANTNADLPQEFVEWAQVPTEPAQLDPAEIDANRETWIEAWTEVVLR